QSATLSLHDALPISFYPARRREGKSRQEDQFRFRLAVNSCRLYKCAHPMLYGSIMTSNPNLDLLDSDPVFHLKGGMLAMTVVELDRKSTRLNSSHVK